MTNIKDMVFSAADLSSHGNDEFDPEKLETNELLRHISSTMMALSDSADEDFEVRGIGKDRLIGFALGMHTAAMLMEDREAYLSNGLVEFELNTLKAMSYANMVNGIMASIIDF